MKKSLLLGMLLIVALPAYADCGQAPTPPAIPEKFDCVYNGYPSCLSLEAQMKAEAADYQQKLSAYNTCLMVEQERASGINSCAVYAPENGTSTLRDDGTCSKPSCNTGYYMTEGGTCKIQPGVLEAQQKALIDVQIAAQDAADKAAATTTTPAPVVNTAPALVVTPTPKPTSIKDVFPFNLGKHEEATATASVTEPAPVSSTPPAQKTFIQKVIHFLFGWI